MSYVSHRTLQTVERPQMQFNLGSLLCMLSVLCTP